MARKKSQTSDAPGAMSTTRGVGYYDWFFLTSGKGARQRDRYLELKKAGMVTETGGQFVPPVRAEKNTYYGVTLFGNQRATLNLRSRA